jgi:hypothetical protein
LTLASTGGVSADSLNIFSCYSGVAGSGAPTIDASGVTKATNIQIRDWFGGLTATFTADCVVSIEAVLGGSHAITTGGGDIEWRGSPKALTITSSGTGTTNVVLANGAPVTVAGTGGTVNVFGQFGTVTDSSGGSVTITETRAQVIAESLGAQAKLDVNAEVVDVLTVDTYSLPGQEAPTATPTFEEAVMYLYKFLRNKKEQTATTFSLYDDAGTTVDQKAPVSDDATTFTKGEIVSGP